MDNDLVTKNIKKFISGLILKQQTDLWNHQEYDSPSLY